ncbi:hypothetical protein F4680DRAFT_468019 [Xylaria scruposa]|nr:hypothetical protein F4680DRAFT_468019 [Xylaria scruposa]
MPINIPNGAVSTALSTSAKHYDAAVAAGLGFVAGASRKAAEWAATKQADETVPEALRLAAGKGRKIAELAAANPGKAVAVGVGVTMVAAPMAVAAPILGAAGFGANGIVAGSIAAGVQAGIGNVVAGSTFATLQSAAMAGYGTAAVAGVVQGLGSAVVAGGFWSMFKNNTKTEGNNDPTDDKEECSESERTDQNGDDGAKDDNNHKTGDAQL